MTHILCRRLPIIDQDSTGGTEKALLSGIAEVHIRGFGSSSAPVLPSSCTGNFSLTCAISIGLTCYYHIQGECSRVDFGCFID